MTNVHGGGKPAAAVLNDLRREVADLAKTEVDKVFTSDPVANALSAKLIDAVRRLREFEDGDAVSQGTAGHVYSTGLEWIYECHLCQCDYRGNAQFSADAFDLLAAHVKDAHMTINRVVNA